MADLTITRGNTLPNSSQKADFHNLIDLATGSVSNIVNADIDSAAAIADTKLAQITTASKVSGAALTITGLTTVTGASGDLLYIADVSDSNNPKKIPISDIVALATYTPTAANALAGSVVQVVNYSTGSLITGSTTMPDDDTIPQNTEGNEIFTLAITPTSATNKLFISVVVHIGENSDAGNIGNIALFQDSTANALNAARCPLQTNPSYELQPLILNHYMTSGTTSSTTFKVRAGNDAGTVNINGANGGRKLGGVLISSITIMEIKV